MGSGGDGERCNITVSPPAAPCRKEREERRALMYHESWSQAELLLNGAIRRRALLFY